MTPSKTLSPTQAQILSAAAQHPSRLAEAPAGLPAAARNAALGSMLKAGLLENLSVPGGASVVFRITEAGLETVGEGITTYQGLARALTKRGVATPRGGGIWTHTTVARVLERLSSEVPFG